LNSLLTLARLTVVVSLSAPRALRRLCCVAPPAIASNPSFFLPKENERLCRWNRFLNGEGGLKTTPSQLCASNSWFARHASPLFLVASSPVEPSSPPAPRSADESQSFLCDDLLREERRDAAKTLIVLTVASVCCCCCFPPSISARRWSEAIGSTKLSFPFEAYDPNLSTLALPLLRTAGRNQVHTYTYSYTYTHPTPRRILYCILCRYCIRCRYCLGPVYGVDIV
jgi:hypothetical protein